MVRFYAVQLVHGLCAIHEHGILHRDVKPENILLDSDGYAKIADFGISKSVCAPDVLCYATSGTHGYMASEIYRRNPKPSHGHSFSADWFSLGVMLHELLTGVLQGSRTALTICKLRLYRPFQPDATEPYAMV
jgi:serine/threonine protein kinase